MESDESNLHTNSLMYTQFDHILGVAPQLARVRGRGFNIQHVSIFYTEPHTYTIALISFTAAAAALLAWPALCVLTAKASLRLTVRNKGVCDVKHYPRPPIVHLTNNSNMEVYNCATKI